MEKISGVYKITNKITGEFYIGSSKDIKHRWAGHKSLSTWKCYPNSKMYQAFQEYGLEKFDFEIIEKTDSLKEREQYFIDLFHPSYNDIKAFRFDCKSYQREYQKSEKYKSYKREYQNQLCEYNGEILTLNALSLRFRRTNIPNPMSEAKKYLIEYN